MESGPVDTLSGMIAIVAGPNASLEVIEARKAACVKCDAKDSAGNTLFRDALGLKFCGAPRFLSVYRDEKRDGCGCVLDLKWQKKLADCPLDKWQRQAVESSKEEKILGCCGSPDISRLNKPSEFDTCITLTSPFGEKIEVPAKEIDRIKSVTVLGIAGIRTEVRLYMNVLILCQEDAGALNEARKKALAETAEKLRKARESVASQEQIETAAKECGLSVVRWDGDYAVFALPGSPHETPIKSTGVYDLKAFMESVRKTVLEPKQSSRTPGRRGGCCG